MSEKFERVSIEEDRVVSFHEHEVLLSFYDDAGALAWNEWWYAEGSKAFKKWLADSDRYSHLVNE